MDPRQDPGKAVRLLLMREDYYQHTPPDLSLAAVSMTACPQCKSEPGAVCVVPSRKWASQFTHQRRLTAWFLAEMDAAIGLYHLTED